jgi:uncharacterized repeat protein (TIGR03847 family)
LVISLVIEKEQATALAIAIGNVLAEADDFDDDVPNQNLDLIVPVRPLFRVGRLNLGHDEAREKLVIIAEELTEEEDEAPARVRIWASSGQMLALAQAAAIAVASGRPLCPLCREVLTPGETHVCIRGNGRKHVS